MEVMANKPARRKAAGAPAAASEPVSALGQQAGHLSAAARPPLALPPALTRQIASSARLSQRPENAPQRLVPFNF
jgi:hypothetical protein